jgi:hypothetical protein
MNEAWNKAISEYAARFKRKQRELLPGQIHLCPICGQKLNIQAGQYQRSGMQMLGLTIECGACEQALALDYIDGE